MYLLGINDFFETTTAFNFFKRKTMGKVLKLGADVTY